VDKLLDWNFAAQQLESSSQPRKAA
jgi:hypothetical protein